jgi:hypothetical protein
MSLRLGFWAQKPMNTPTWHARSCPEPKIGVVYIVMPDLGPLKTAFLEIRAKSAKKRRFSKYGPKTWFFGPKSLWAHLLGLTLASFAHEDTFLRARNGSITPTEKALRSKCRLSSSGNGPLMPRWHRHTQYRYSWRRYSSVTRGKRCFKIIAEFSSMDGRYLHGYLSERDGDRGEPAPTTA